MGLAKRYLWLEWMECLEESHLNWVTKDEKKWSGKDLAWSKEMGVFRCLFFMQTGSRRVAHLVGLFCMGLGFSPRLAQLFTNIPLPVLGE